MVFSVVLNGGPIPKDPNAVESEFHQVACNAGPLSTNRGPAKEKTVKILTAGRIAHQMTSFLKFSVN